MSRQDRKPTAKLRRDRWRWRRRALKALVALVALVVLVPAGLVLSLKSSGVRQALLRWGSETVVSSLGFHASVRDFSFGARRGELTIDDIELRATPEARPFVSVDSARIAWSWRSLFGERLFVRSLQVDRPRVDLGAPLPELPVAEADATESAPPAVDVESIALAGGSVICDSLATLLKDPSQADQLEMWLDAFRVGGLLVTGSYHQGTARLDIASPELVIESRRRPPIDLALKAGLEATADGAMRFEGVRLEGDGLELTTDGSLSPGDNQSSRPGPLDLAFVLRASPAKLLPDLTTGGRLEGDGELNVLGDRLTGNIRLDAHDLPAEMLQPMLADADFEIEGTVLDADVDLAIEAKTSSGGDPLDRVAGTAEVAWRRGEEPLVTAGLRALDDDPKGIGLAFQAEVLPAEAGFRRASGELRAPGWLALDQGKLNATRLEVDAPDLAAAAARLGLPEESGGFRLNGELRALTEVSGPILRPRLNLDASWSLNDEPLAKIAAQTMHNVAPDGPLHFTLEAELLPKSEGRRSLSGEVLAADIREAGAGELAGVQVQDLRLDVEIPDLEAAVQEIRRYWTELLPGLELPGPLAEDSALATGILTTRAFGFGPVLGPSIRAEIDWRPAAGERVQLELAGDAVTTSPYFSGEASLLASDLDASRFIAGGSEPVTGRFSASLDFDGDLGSHQATLEVGIENLRSGDGVGIEQLALQAQSDGSSARIDAVSGSLSNGQPFSGQGTVELALLPPSDSTSAEDPDGTSDAGRSDGGDGELLFELPRPIETLERLVASIELDDGIAFVELALVRPDAAPKSVAVARARIAELIAGEGIVQLDIMGLDIEPFVPLLGLDEGVPRPRATVDGSLTIHPTDLLVSNGTLEITELALEGKDGDVRAASPLRLELRDRRLVLEPGRLLGSGGGALEVAGSLQLSDRWSPGDDPTLLVTDMTFDADGRFETSVLNPLLVGGRAAGELEMALEVRGTPAAPQVEGRFEGPGVELFYAAPYVTRIAAPVLEIGPRAEGAGVAMALEARVNGGDLTLSGDLSPVEGLALAATLTGVRYRVDYGLTARVGGDLEFHRPAGGPRSLLTGDVVLERGSLRNDVLLDRNTLARLLAPDMASVEDAGVSDLIDLDLTVTTASGVSVKNNLGQLNVDWSRLRVRGTLQNPVLTGQIDVDPGGTLTAYGQTLRIDEASIAFSGDMAAPRIVLETTSSLEDPSVKRGRSGLAGGGLGDSGPGSGGYWNRRETGDVDVSNELTVGVLTDLGDRAAGSLARGLSRTELSLEPLQIFGETDTSARLTASQQVAKEANLIYSVNPRDAEGQTYILELRDPDIAPSLTAQIFTNDDDNAGATLQQTLQLGPGGRSGEQGRRLGGTRIHAPEQIDRRRLKQAIGLRKSDPFPDDAEFDVEVDAIEALRRQGYPAAAVKVVMDSTEPRRPIIDLTVDPGPRVRFEFEGTRPPRPQRRTIVQAYSPTAEEASLELLRQATVKALRGQGHLEPKVEITVESTPGESPGDQEKTVRIFSDGGREVSLEKLELLGVPSAVAEQTIGEFESLLSRVELAIANPGADSYLLQYLAGLGFPRARIASRELSEDGKTLAVRLESGRRQQLARVEILGLEDSDAARLAAELPIAAGDPVRSDLITAAAHQLEDKLRDRGHAQATVSTTLEPAMHPEHGESPSGADQVVRFEVDAGPVHQIAGMRLEGLHGTRPAWAERLTGLETGEVFRDDEVGKARRQLMATGLFEGVRTTTESKSGDGTEEPSVETTVVFDIEERPRFQLSYGGRWESGEGLGLVVDAVDQSFLGRGTTLGVRAIYANRDERSLRLYHAIPRIIGPRSSLEVFLEGKNEDVDGLLVSGVETWTQLTFSVSRRTRSRLYFRYQDLSVEEKPSTEEVADPGQRLRIPSLGWQFSFDTRDRALGARRPDGVSLSVDMVASDVRSGDDTGALGVFSQFKLFHSFAEKTTGKNRGFFTWAQSFRVGLLEPFEDAEIPAVNRLRAGGEYSVRGYRRESLGPLDSDDEALGGELLFVVNQELRFPVWGDWLGGLVFFDAGNVWSSREALDSELFSSAGFGLRALTPAGPLRLDIAVPFDRRADIDESVRIYVGFGNVF